MKAKNWILWGIPVIGIVGPLMHFVYGWSGEMTWVGIFAPVNESVWEHLKLTFWPMLIWWLAWYVFFGRKQGAKPAAWFTAAAVALIVCPLVVLTFFYTYTGAFGIESLALDIFSVYLALAAAQGLAAHIYKFGRFNRAWLVASIAVILLLIAAFTLFTFAPPHIPLFMDSNTGGYGI